MSTIEDIKAAIKSLSEKEYVQLRQWFTERDWEQWDKQLEEDSTSGKLDFLVKEAGVEKAKDSLRNL